MYKIYFNSKTKEVLQSEKLNETKIISMIQKFLKEQRLSEKQDIICVLELPGKKLALMGGKNGNRIDITHATTKAFIA